MNKLIRVQSQWFGLRKDKLVVVMSSTGVFDMTDVLEDIALCAKHNIGVQRYIIKQVGV